MRSSDNRSRSFGPAVRRSLRAPWPLLWLTLAFVLLLAGYAEAKRFKHYPDDVEKEKQAQQTDREPAANDQMPEEAEDEEADSEEQPAGGLFGTFLHGRDPWRVEYIYTGEVFTNMRGGIRTRDATKYLGLFDLAVTGKLDEMGLFPGGTVFLLGEDSHGRGLTEQFVGDQQLLSNIDPGRQFTQVSEFWWERTLLDECTTVRLGKQDANAEFACVDLGGDFVNAAFGLHPNIPMPAWPHPAMGVMALFKLGEPLTLKFGVYDGAADGGTWGFSGTGDVFSIGEIEGQWKLDERLPGDFHVGMWHHSGPSEDLSAAPAAQSGDQSGTLATGTVNGNHGVYLGADQMLLRESQEENDEQGLGVFVQYAWASEDRSVVPHYLGGGLVYKGLLRNRDDDITGVGVAHAIFSPYLVDRTPETAIELFHKVQWSKFIVVQPDLQYIVSPGGRERDAFVFGLRSEVVL